MVVRLSSPRTRLAIVGASLLLTAFLSYFSLREARAAFLASSQSSPGLDVAVRLEPGNANYWYLLGHYWQYNLDQHDLSRAIADYKQSLALNPRSFQAWLDLAESYEADGDSPSADDAFHMAGDAYPASAEVAWRYGNFLLRRGDLSAAFDEIRRSLVADPARAKEAVTVCWRAAPYIEPILDRALPPSRDVYLSALAVLVGLHKNSAALVVWTRLVALQPKLKLTDASTLIDSLLAEGQAAEAQRVWRQALVLSGTTRPDDPPGSLIWDGGFETDISTGMAWRIASTRGAQVSFDMQVKHSGRRALRVRFDGTENVNFAAVCQWVPVEPQTSYRFSAWMQTETLTTDKGVFFRFAAPESPASAPPSTPELTGTEPWSRFSASVNAGNGIHLLQVCLARAASDKLDNRIAGTVWVDDVALTPENPPAVPGARPAKRPAPAKKSEP